MLNWANRFNIFCFLDDNNYGGDKLSFDCILAAGSLRSIDLFSDSAFEHLKLFHESDPSWLFGHLGYDLKNEKESGYPLPPPGVDFGPGFFFQPRYILEIKNGQLKISSSDTDPRVVYHQINDQPLTHADALISEVAINATINKEQYISIVGALKAHILRGDCYEINFCQNFFAEDVLIGPMLVYQKLVAVSPTPFTAFYKKNDTYCICASPERYLKKTGNKLMSQPMKGTSPRDLVDKVADDNNLNYLKSSSKEKSENVMVVDLVRNDLSKICAEGSVKVVDLFAIHSFPQVHQMTSTVTGILRAELHWTDAISATFPMGSMTGAPKKRVMELISQYETRSRGLFSGSIGYVTPNGDFDFNVVIRSIFYDEGKKYLDFFAGSGITFYSSAEDEYEECIIKTSAILKALGA